MAEGEGTQGGGVRVDGTWEVVTRTPMGDQTVTLVIVSDGDTFTGRSESALGALELENGRIAGDEISWTMQLTAPMRLTLEARATIAGDTLSGKVKAGLFGASAMTGRRLA